MVTFSQVQLDAWLAGILLPFLRILALFSSAPMLSHQSFPMRARVAVAALIAFVAAPFANVPAGITMDSPAAFGYIAQQVAIGLAIGFAARLLFGAFEIAGELIGLQMGLSFGGFFDPSGAGETAVGSWLYTLSLMLFVALNGHLLLIGAVVDSFRAFPIAANPFEVLNVMRLDKLGADMFQLALSLALPATMLMLLVNLTLGFASRVAPQLSIVSVGFPVTLLAGLAALALGAQDLLGPLMESLDRFLAPVR